MTDDLRLLLTAFTLVTAIPSTFFKHNSDIYETARKHTAESGGPLGRMRGLQRVVLDRVGNRLARSAFDLAKEIEKNDGQGIDVGAATREVMEGSAEDLAAFNKAAELLDERDEVTRSVRDLARRLKGISIAAGLVAASTAGLAYLLQSAWVLVLPVAFLIPWAYLQGRLARLQNRQDRISDEYNKVEALHLDVD